MTQADLQTKIINLIQDKFAVDIQLEGSTSLLDSGLNLDSLRILELVMYLEESFEIMIPDDELDPEIFQTVESLVTFLSGKVALAA